MSFAEVQESGLAAVYSARFQGKTTASGEVFNHNDLTASHRSFAYGTFVKITRLDNGKSVIVRINDRGPFVSDYVTNLSQAAANRLDMSSDNEVRVRIEVVDERKGQQIKSPMKVPSRRTLPPVEDEPMRQSEALVVTPKGLPNRNVPREYQNRPVPNGNPRFSASPQKKNVRL